MRALAAVAVDQVLSHGRSLSDVLPEAAPRLNDSTHSALLQELVYGTLRWAPQLEAVAGQLLRKPLKAKDSDIFALILVGLYQLMHLRVAPHAAVSLSVAAAEELKKEWAKGLLNALLRGYQRDPALLERANTEAASVYAHPDWLLDRLRKDWPEDWSAIATANNARPPMTLRVNRRRQSRADYLTQLQHAELDARCHEFAPDALILNAPVDVDRLPGFAQGFVSVQDAAAQLAAVLLDAQPGERVLDACAAPGGKTAHVLECQPELVELVALDRDEKRMRRVSETLKRLGVEATCVVADAGDASAWWDGRPFDRILLDAPCSATGVIRRHPDIKMLRQPEDIAQVVAEQARLLATLWTTLRPGGLLLYATCSVLRDENDGQLRRFFAAHADAEPVNIAASWGRVGDYGWQILPGDADMDGFYYACIRKK